MKKLFLSLMAIAAITLTGCKNKVTENEPTPPENGRSNSAIMCSCGNMYILSPGGTSMASIAEHRQDYKVYTSGIADVGILDFDSQHYPFVTYKEGLRYEAYYFWRCACGRYHKVMKDDKSHTEIANGQQPSDWNQFNYLWE